MRPQFSIITPSLNQGVFLRSALASVARQRGVFVEHVIVDPGSTDQSREIAQTHLQRAPMSALHLGLTKNPAAAINFGFSRTQGEIFGWLCADDLYLGEEALARVAATFADNPSCDVVFGRGVLVDARGKVLAPGPFQPDVDAVVQTLLDRDAFLQPACFVRRSALDRFGALDSNYRRAFDHDLWLRLAVGGAGFVALDAILCGKRRHREAYSSLLPAVRARECAEAVFRRCGHSSRAWSAAAIVADAPSSGRASAVPRRRETAITNTVRCSLERLGRQADVLVVLGNGPSLAGFDFGELQGYDCIGMNAAYRYWRRIGWRPRYYACLDEVVGLSHKANLEELIRNAGEHGFSALLLRKNLIDALPPELARSPALIDFDELAYPGGILDSTPLTTGSHAALFGALLGYRRLLLLGVDCNYVEMVEGARAGPGVMLELTATPKRNPNYFFDGYQVSGDRYHIPNPTPDLHLDAWRSAGVRLADRDVEVRNCSLGSRVDAFAKCAWSGRDRGVPAKTEAVQDA